MLVTRGDDIVAADWFAPLARFAALAGGSRCMIIYGGDADQPRTSSPVYGWRAIGRALDCIFDWLLNKESRPRMLSLA